MDKYLFRCDDCTVQQFGSVYDELLEFKEWHEQETKHKGEIIELRKGEE